MSRPRQWPAIHLRAASCVIAIASATIQAEDAQTAMWQPRMMEFLPFLPSTVIYGSCEDVLTNKIRLLLIAAGARDDAKVDARCGTPLPAILAFSAPVPADSMASDAIAAPQAPNAVAASDAFPARWTSVSLDSRRSRDFQDGDCGLVEEFVRLVLPSLPVRNIHKRIACITGQTTSYSVSFEVLEPVTPPPKKKVALWPWNHDDNK